MDAAKRKFDSVEHEVIYELLRKSIKQQKDSDIHNSQEEPITFSIVNSQLIESIAAAKSTSINTVDKPITDWRNAKVWKHLAIFVKRCIRKCLRWYVSPLVDRQNDFNTSAVQVFTSAVQVFSQIESIANTIVAEVEGFSTKIVNENEKLRSIIEQQQIEMGTQTALSKLHQAEIANQRWRIDQFQTDFERQKSHAMLIEQQQEEAKRQMTQQREALENQKMEMQTWMQNAQTDRSKQLNEDHRRMELIELRLQSVVSSAGGQFMDDFGTFQKMTYSQAGEDCIILYILHELNRDDFLNISYLDLGSNDPIKMNNTYFLYRHGARGVLVDANPDFTENLRAMRPGDAIINGLIDIQDGLMCDFYILNGDGLSTPDLEQAQENIKKNNTLRITRTVSVETVTINTLIEKYLAGRAPTVMSLDIEGMDMDALKSINFEKYRPLIIIVEMITYNTKLTVEAKNTEIDVFLKNLKYVEYAFTGINSIYVDSLAL
jgi:hypothetical protein